MSRKPKVAIVILNYCNYRETEACIRSIALLSCPLCGVVVVDNGSSNASALWLRKRYHSEHKIHLLSSKKNLGFAKGNNIGIHYARKTLHADFVLCVNSDIIFTEKDYIEKLLSAYHTGVGIIGSRVTRRGGGNWTECVRLPWLFYKYLALLCYYWRLDLPGDLLNAYISRQHNSKEELLEGCCILFTPDFLRIYPGFYPRTFLYFEEAILYIMCQLSGLEQVKVSEASIYHKWKKSTPSCVRDRIFYKYGLKSLKYAMWMDLRLRFRQRNQTEIGSLWTD